jgi:hypothetical protein
MNRKAQSAVAACFAIALVVAWVEAAGENRPAKAAPRKIETLACRLGTEDSHARIAVELLDGRVNRFAYYSKWKPRTCSMEVVRGDAFSQWLDQGATTAVVLRDEMGSLWIDHGQGRVHFTFSDVDRVRYCGMEGKINGYLTVRRADSRCELHGLLERGEADE